MHRPSYPLFHPSLFHPSVAPQKKLVDYSKSTAEIPNDDNTVLPSLRNLADRKEQRARTSDSNITQTSTTKGAIGPSSSGARVNFDVRSPIKSVSNSQEGPAEGPQEWLPLTPIERSRPSRYPSKPQRQRRVLRISSLNNSDSSRLALYEKPGIFSRERGVRSKSSTACRDGAPRNLPSESQVSITRNRSVSRATSFDRHDRLRRSSPTSPTELSSRSGSEGIFKTQESFDIHGSSHRSLQVSPAKITRGLSDSSLRRQKSSRLNSPKSVFDELATSVHSVSQRRKSMYPPDSSREISLSPVDRERIKREFSRRSSRRNLFEETESIPDLPLRGIFRRTSSQRQIKTLVPCQPPRKPERQKSLRSRAAKTPQSAPMRSLSDHCVMKQLHEDLRTASVNSRSVHRTVPERATSDGKSLMALHSEMRRANLVRHSSSRRLL